MKLPRATLRNLMIAVAIVALTFKGYRWWCQSRVYAAKAQIYQIRSSICQLNICSEIYDPHTVYPTPLKNYNKANVAFFQLCDRYESFMYRKYRWLAFFPWLTVTPDPPVPPETLWLK